MKTKIGFEEYIDSKSHRSHKEKINLLYAVATNPLNIQLTLDVEEGSHTEIKTSHLKASHK